MKLPFFNLTSEWTQRRLLKPGQSVKPIVSDLSLRDVGELLEKKDGRPMMVVKFTGKIGMCQTL